MSARLERELTSEPAWMYGWQLDDGRRAPVLHPGLAAVHRTREEMIAPVVSEALRLAKSVHPTRAIDLGCNEGAFSHLLLDWGATNVLGLDVRERNIMRANLIRDHRGIPETSLHFETVDVTTVDPGHYGAFDVVLLLGLIYHLENPAGAVRLARALTRSGGLCVLETQLTRQNDPVVHGWGSQEMQLAQGSFGLVWERDEQNMLASALGVVSLVPNSAAVVTLMQAAGFDSVRWLEPAPHHDPQYVDHDRGVIVGFAAR